MLFHPPIRVSAGAEREEVEAKHAEMQRALERVRDAAHGWWRLSHAERDRMRTEWNA